MFKKNLFFAIVFTLSFFNCAFAIEWKEVVTPRNILAFIDIDSIKENSSFYFYNVKYCSNDAKEYKVYTIQTSKVKSMSAKIKEYSLEEYEKLNGDYQNILNNETTILQANLFGSLLHTCHSEIIKIKSTEALEIEF